MRIAVDAGALSDPPHGIARYLREILERVLADPAHRWSLYGRATAPALALAPREAVESGRIAVRSDGLPVDAGRVAALFSTLPAWCARDRPDVYWGPAHRLPVVLPARTAAVVTIHDLCWWKAPGTMRAATRWLDRTLMPVALRRADRIIAVSHATRDDLCERFPGLAPRILVVHEAAGPVAAPHGREWLHARNIASPYVLFVGTIEPRKNLARLLQAVALLPAGLRATSLVIAGGDGWGDVALDREIATLGLGDRVRRAGRLGEPELATLYRHAECLALPSLYEGFGLPLVEAMAHGTPVVTSNVSSMPEVGGEGAVLVDPLDAASIARGLAQVLGDAGFRATLSDAARRQAQRFSWATAAKETIAVFESASQDRAARRDGSAA